MTELALSDTVARKEALARVARFLEQHGAEEAKRDARELLLAASGLSRLDLLLSPGAFLSAEAARKLGEFARRRAAREPVSRILGRRGFWTLDLGVAPDVFDPRPDTETLVELALDRFCNRRGDAISILDFGTGSGAIVCALLSEFANARALAVDMSAVACAAAKANFERCGFSSRAAVMRGDWADAVNATFDLVVSNPPYVRSDEIDALAPEVKLYDPQLALDGGADGFACYRRIACDLPRLLAPEGQALLEVGARQAPAVCAILSAQGLDIAEIRRDAGGHERVIAATRPRLS